VKASMDKLKYAAKYLYDMLRLSVMSLGHVRSVHGHVNSLHEHGKRISGHCKSNSLDIVNIPMT
jgi:hypothetical protein